jgi:hypothetical protein
MAAQDREQTLQWLFMCRKYLSTTNEPILCRELPTCYAGEQVRGRADLLAFDHISGQPILVELKNGDANDSLCGVVLELLHHWAFHMRHKDQLQALVREYTCEATASCRLALIAPAPFYREAKRRSKKRHGEFERAIDWINGLASSNVVSIDLYVLDSDWQEQGIHFRVLKLSNQ